MDLQCKEIFQSRLGRLIHMLESFSYQSLHDIKHELECIVSIASCLLSRSAVVSVEYDVLSTFVGLTVQSLDCIDHAAVGDRYANNFSCSVEINIGPGFVGRPAYEISFEQLNYLAEQGFSAVQMAEIVGASTRTIQRRLSEHGISLHKRFSDISDRELDEHVKNIVTSFPNIGYRSVKGHLSSANHVVQEARVRDSMRRVDLEGVLCRQMTLKPALRRTYSVPASNSLWHIDGYHKLIRWRLVIHGGVDGFSRVPVYLKISNNNKAETVLHCFVEAVHEFSAPDRVRSDKGNKNTNWWLLDGQPFRKVNFADSLCGENVSVADFMIRNKGAGSHITGRSVHNQRIERFWRDLWTGCIMLFYNLFYHMESLGLLNPDNEVHLQCLHYVYIPRIQDHLNRFRLAYMKKPLRTAGNRTPLQLFIQGQMNRPAILPDDGDFGIEEGMYAMPDEIAAVNIPETPSNLFHRFTSLDPMKMSSSYGIDLYEEALNYVHVHRP